MSMKPLTLRLPADDLSLYESWARREGKTLSAWLRDVLAWYLAPEQRRLRTRSTRTEGDRVRVQVNSRIHLPKRFLDALDVRPGDELYLAAADGTLVLSSAEAPTADQHADR